MKNSIAQGVYCPNRDASWEINDEFVEQLGLLRPMSCYQGDKCKYPDDIYNPATHNRTSKEIILCHDCGNNGSHIECDAVSCVKDVKLALTSLPILGFV